MAEPARKSDKRYGGHVGATDEPKEKVTEKTEGTEGGAAEHNAEVEKPKGHEASGRHAQEHKDMAKRHEKEHRDLHGNHRDAMRSMVDRHAAEMAAMHTKHAGETAMPAEAVGDAATEPGGAGAAMAAE